MNIRRSFHLNGAYSVRILAVQQAIQHNKIWFGCQITNLNQSKEALRAYLPEVTSPRCASGLHGLLETIK